MLTLDFAPVALAGAFASRFLSLLGGIVMTSLPLREGILLMLDEEGGKLRER